MSDNDLNFGIDFDVDEALSGIQKLTKSFEKLKSRTDAMAKSSPTAGSAKEMKAVERQLKKLLAQVDVYSKQFGTKLTKMAGSALAGSIAAVKTAMATLLVTATAAAAGLAAGIGAALKSGIGNNEQLEGLKNSLGATVSSLYELNDASGKPLQGLERFNAAAAQSEAQLEQLRKAASQTGYALPDLSAALEMGMAKGAASGMGSDIVQRLVEDITQAAPALGVAGDALQNEMKALLNGEGLEESKIARALMIDAATLASWKEQGTLANELSGRLGDLKNSAEQAEQSYSQLTGRMSVGLNNALTEATSGAYDALKEGLGNALDGLFDENGELLPRFQALYDTVSGIFTSLGEAMGAAIEGAVEVAGWLSEALEENRDVIAAIRSIFGQVVNAISGAVTRVKDLFSGISKSKEPVVKLETAFKAVSTVIGIVVDGVKTIVGSFGMIGAAVLKLGGGAGAKVAKALGLDGLAEFAQGMADTGDKIGSAAKDLTTEGLEFQATQEALNTSLAEAIAEQEKQDERLEKLREKRKKRERPPTAGPASLNVKTNPAVKALEAEKKAAEDLKKALEALAGTRIAAQRQAFADTQAEKAAELDKEVALSLLSKKEELAQRKALELAAIKEEQAAVAAERAAMAATAAGTTDKAALAQIEAQLVAIEAKAASLASKETVFKVRAEIDTISLEKELEAEKKSIEAQLKDLLGVPEDLAAQRAAALDTALAKSDGDLQSRINALYDAKEARNTFEEQAHRVTQLRDDLAANEAEYQRQYEQGALTIFEYETKIKNTRLQSAEALKTATTEMAKAAEKTGNSALIKDAQAAAHGVKVVADSVNEVRNNEVANLKSDFGQMFKDIASGSKSAAQAMLDVFTNALMRMAERMATQWTDSLFKTTSNGGGGFGDFFNSISSWFAGSFATGGIIRGKGSGTSDSLLAAVSTGEGITTAKVNARYPGLVDHLNSGGSLTSFAQVKGMVAAAASMPTFSPELVNNVSVSPEVHLDLNEVSAALARLPAHERHIVKLVTANRRRIG